MILLVFMIVSFEKVVFYILIVCSLGMGGWYFQ